MNVRSDSEVTQEHGRRKWPWWEPYAFTAGVLAAFVVVLIAFGYIARVPYFEHVFFVLWAIAVWVGVFRGSSTPPSLVGNICLAAFFGLAGVAYLSKSKYVLGIGYVGLAPICLFLAIRAGTIQRARTKEGLAKLDRAVETLRRAVQNDE
jgi:hypothetical protein